MPMECRPEPGQNQHHWVRSLLHRCRDVRATLTRARTAQMNIGCQNGTGKYIHPGDPTNVYEQFVVEANPLLGVCKSVSSRSPVVPAPFPSSSEV